MISFIIGSTKPVLAAVDALGGLLGGIRHWLQSRRDYRTLCGMSERDLRDLGLRDSDLRDATAAPFFGDPTGIISLRAEERRGLAGGESVDELLRGLDAGASARLERSTGESDSGENGRMVFLKAAE